jgi:hypothetical protein
MSWTAGIVGDMDGALREASVILEQLRGQDEPLWTALALATLGSGETAVGRHDDALGHLLEVRDLGERFDSAWLVAWSQAQLGTLAVVWGRPKDAQPLLNEALDLSLAAHSTHVVAMCLAAFAGLAFVEGDAERAALVTGAAAGLRQRASLWVWPLRRRLEAQLLAQIRQALGADRFEEVFADGARLSQREAVAAVRERRGVGTRAS